MFFWYFSVAFNKNCVAMYMLSCQIRIFDFKYLFLSLGLFIMALCSSFVINGASFARIYIFLIVIMFITCLIMFMKNTGDCILETVQIRSIKIKFGDIRPKFLIVKIFIVPIVYYFRWQFLEAHFKLSDVQ